MLILEVDYLVELLLHLLLVVACLEVLLIPNLDWLQVAVYLVIIKVLLNLQLKVVYLEVLPPNKIVYLEELLLEDKPVAYLEELQEPLNNKEVAYLAKQLLILLKEEVYLEQQIQV